MKNLIISFISIIIDITINIWRRKEEKDASKKTTEKSES